MKIKAETLFAKARNLSIPVQPYNYRTTLILCQDPKTTSSHLSDIISSDYGLSHRLVTTVYSAFFSLERKDILSIRYMIVLIGMLNLKNMIIKAPTLGRKDEDILILYLGAGLLISFLARRISELADMDWEKAEICGLFQNIGEVAAAASVPKIVKNSLVPDSYVIKRRRFARLCSGYNPRRLGERLARHWNFPELVRMAIIPDDFDLNSLPEEERTILHLVDLLNLLIKKGFSAKTTRSAIKNVCETICELLGFRPIVLERAIGASVNGLESKCPTYYKHLEKTGLLKRILP